MAKKTEQQGSGDLSDLEKDLNPEQTTEPTAPAEPAKAPGITKAQINASRAISEDVVNAHSFKEKAVEQAPVEMIRVRALEKCFYQKYRAPGSVFNIPKHLAMTPVRKQVGNKVIVGEEMVLAPHLELVDAEATTQIKPTIDLLGGQDGPYGKPPIKRKS